MADSPDLEARVTALGAEVRELSEQLRLSRRGILTWPSASEADQDPAEASGEVRESGE